MEGIPEEILEHYERSNEVPRITEGFGRLELLRVQEIVRRHLPLGSLQILDVGGGPGVHAAWLAAEGHRVQVIDPVSRHVAENKGSTQFAERVTAQLGDARSLPVIDSAVDVVLLFGPLYHLVDRSDRILAWSEARRVVRPGGLVLGAAISRFASLFDGLSSEALFDMRFRGIVEQDLLDGQHRNPTTNPAWFTTAYFHRPEELSIEATESGLKPVELVGVEGLAKWLPHLESRWNDPSDREAILFSAQATGGEPSLIGLSAHLILVAQRSSD